MIDQIIMILMVALFFYFLMFLAKNEEQNMEIIKDSFYKGKLKGIQQCINLVESEINKTKKVKYEPNSPRQIHTRAMATALYRLKNRMKHYIEIHEKHNG